MHMHRGASKTPLLRQCWKQPARCVPYLFVLVCAGMARTGGAARNRCTLSRSVSVAWSDSVLLSSTAVQCSAVLMFCSECVPTGWQSSTDCGPLLQQHARYTGIRISGISQCSRYALCSCPMMIAEDARRAKQKCIMLLVVF